MICYHGNTTPFYQKKEKTNAAIIRKRMNTMIWKVIRGQVSINPKNALRTKFKSYLFQNCVKLYGSWLSQVRVSTVYDLHMFPLICLLYYLGLSRMETLPALPCTWEGPTDVLQLHIAACDGAALGLLKCCIDPLQDVIPGSCGPKLYTRISPYLNNGLYKFPLEWMTP